MKKPISTAEKQSQKFGNDFEFHKNYEVKKFGNDFEFDKNYEVKTEMKRSRSNLNLFYDNDFTLYKNCNTKQFAKHCLLFNTK